MKRRKSLILFAATLFVFLSDFLGAYLAEKSLLENNAYFEDRYKEVKLSFEEKSVPGRYGQIYCKFDYKFYIYGYQTCFMPAPGVPKHERGYHFVYTPPKRKLAILFRGDGPENYYFQQLQSSGKFLKFILIDGKILDGDRR